MLHLDTPGHCLTIVLEFSVVPSAQGMKHPHESQDCRQLAKSMGVGFT
jgi:hypothetical protein